MLKVLDYSVEFPTTGRCFANRIEFAPGLTAITGRNEAGKTVVFEMIGYCLFGKTALRGKAADYSNLTASLTFDVGEKKVEITRARREIMKIDGKEHAVGAEAINKAVPHLLGFGLDVFNIACAAQQQDLGRLTAMRPTERRAMVDRLIGLDQLEVVEKECKVEARAKTVLAESLILSVTAPQEPVRPDGYRPSDVIESDIALLREAQSLREALLRVKEPVAPVAPEAPAEINVAELQQHEADRQITLQKRASINGELKNIPLATVHKAQLDAALAYREYQQEVKRRGPQPTLELNELRQLEAILDAKAKAGAEVACPECDHHFHVGLTKEEEQLQSASCPLSKSEITTEFRRHELWAEPLAEVEEVIVEHMDEEISAIRLAPRRKELMKALKEMVLPEDKAAELAAARSYVSAMSLYEDRIGRYDTEQKKFTEAQFLLSQGKDLTDELELARELLTFSRQFERQLETYANERERYEVVLEQSRVARAAGEGYTAGATALNATRIAVKQELAPALSLAASSLIASMTGGERTSVVVDEDFEVTVDGQPLQTLSGSGKSVVNLALRIGMGQVLTRRVLPIFLGDEINADMDEDRAGTTHTTMESLREYLTQIILVTHKEIEVDQVIAL